MQMGQVGVLIMMMALGFSPMVAHAQMDPSSALLLDSNSPGSSGETPIDTGHYTIRQKDPAVRTTTKKTKRTTIDTTPITVAVPAATPLEVARPQSTSPVVHEEVAPAPSATPPPVPVTIAAPPAAPRSTPVPVATPHLNLVDLELSAGYLYNDSESTYAFRNYTDSSPTLGVSANVWLASAFGLHGAFTSTLNDSVSEAASIAQNKAVTQTWYEVGVRSRQLFGDSPTSPQLQFGLDYIDYSFKVDASSLTRAKLETSGVQLAIDALLPSSESRTWMFGLRVAPFLGHQEGATDINFHSGSGVSASSFGVSFGMRYQLSRTDSIFWRFTETVERDLFTGSATIVDPYTGVVPSGVPVTNSFSLFQVGYSWGD